MNSGVTLYSEIMSPYPPVMYLLGAFVLRLTRSYQVIKIVDISVGVGVSLLLYTISKTLFSKNWRALIAPVIYLFLPIRYGFSPGFYPDVYSLFFGFFALFLVQNPTKKKVSLAGFFLVLAFFTKYTTLALFFAGLICLVTEKKGISSDFTFLPPP